LRAITLALRSTRRDGPAGGGAGTSVRGHHVRVRVRRAHSATAEGQGHAPCSAVRAVAARPVDRQGHACGTRHHPGHDSRAARRPVRPVALGARRLLGDSEADNSRRRSDRRRRRHRWGNCWNGAATAATTSATATATRRGRRPRHLDLTGDRAARSRAACLPDPLAHARTRASAATGGRRRRRGRGGRGRAAAPRGNRQSRHGDHEGKGLAYAHQNSRLLAGSSHTDPNQTGCAAERGGCPRVNPGAGA